MWKRDLKNKQKKKTAITGQRKTNIMFKSRRFTESWKQNSTFAITPIHQKTETLYKSIPFKNVSCCQFEIIGFEWGSHKSVIKSSEETQWITPVLQSGYFWRDEHNELRPTDLPSAEMFLPAVVAGTHACRCRETQRSGNHVRGTGGVWNWFFTFSCSCSDSFSPVKRCQRQWPTVKHVQTDRS